MRIKCGSVDCKFNSVKNTCQYKGTLCLSECYYHTVNEGLQHFWRCKQYEELPLKDVGDFSKNMTRYQDGDNF